MFPWGLVMDWTQWLGIVGLFALLGGGFAGVARITGWRVLAEVIGITLGCAVFAVGVSVCVFLAVGVPLW